MAKKRKKKRGHSKAVPVLAALLLILIIGAVGIITSYIKKYTPSDARMNLDEYYAQTKEDDVALILQDTVSETKGKLVDGEVYLPYSVAVQQLGSRFYWDEETQAMLYTTAEEVVSIQPESTSYTIGGQTVTEEVPPVRKMEDTYYLALHFLQDHMQMTAEVYENPNRAVIRYQWETVQTVPAAEDTVIRYQGGIKSPILGDVKQGDSLLLLEEMEDWSRVMTQDGLDGYVEKKALGSIQETELAYTGSYEEKFPSQVRDHKINLAWHQVTSEAANSAMESDIKDMTGVNVISPTWFSVVSTEGNISSLASKEYVDKAHAKNLEVWGLIDNFNESVSTYDTLVQKSSRSHIIEMLISEAKRVGLDGINVDFETLTEEEAPHFIQFIRELSVACRKEQLVLSIDNPVPSYTYFYNRKEQGIVADYVIIMGYDEHTAGFQEAGSVASLPFVEEGITETLKEVPAQKVINGVPFYTRLWTVGNDGSVSSEVCSMDQADQYVKEKGMEVYWNTEVSQNYAEAETESGTQQIWLEDEESLEAKMKLIKEYDLAGCAAWKLGFERADVWDIISSYLQ